MKAVLYFLFVLVASVAFGQNNSLQTVIQKGHDRAVLAVTVSPDSNYVVTGSRDKSAKLWELRTGREVRSFLGHEGSVNCIDFSKDGKQIITSSGDHTAKIWDIVTGKEMYASAPEEKILTAAAFSPDMKYFITAGFSNNAIIRDLTSKKIIKTIPVDADQGSGYGINLSFSPDGRWLAIGEDNRVASVYKTSTWEKAYTFKHDIGSCGGCATWVEFSHDSQFLVMASNKSPVKRYALKDGNLATKYADEENDLAGLFYSPDDKQITIVTKKELIQWDAQSGKELNRTTLSETEINEATITLDGKNILLARADNTVAIWDLPSKKITRSLTGILNERDKGGVNYDPESYWESHIARYLRFKNDLLLSRDGKNLIKGKFGTKVRRWDIATGRTEVEYAAHDKAAICYELSRDGNLLLTGGADGKVILWDARKGDTLKIIKAHREPVFDVHFSRDESKVLCSSWDSSIKIYDLASGKQLEYLDLNNASAYNVLFSANDLYIFAAQLGEAKLTMWEIDTKKIVREFIGHSDVISSIRLSPDGKKMLSTSWDSSIRLWDIATGLMDAKFKGHRGPVYTATFSADGKTLFSGGADRIVRLWDVASGKVIRSFEGHQAEVTSILLTNDEKMLITHSTDGVTKFWDLTSGAEFFEHIHVGEKDWMVKTKDSYFNGTDNARKSIHFVDGLKTYSVDQFFNEFYRPDLLPEIFKTRGSVDSDKSIQGKLKSSPPPAVQVATVAGTDSSKLTLYIKITDQGGGAANLKIFHNGKNVPVDQQAITLPSKKGESTVYKQTVDIVGGVNIFSATATNRDNVESDPRSAEYFSAISSKVSTCHILAVGINEYKNQRMSLNYAKPDAQSFAQLIDQSSNQLFKNVELHTLYDQEASREKILAKLDELSAKVHPEDVFVFYYAGHGSMVDSRFFFIPTESLRLYDIKSLQKEAIEASVLQDKFRQIKALKQLIIMDACQSGGSVELLATRGAGEEKAIAQLSRSAGIHVLASAGSDQFATEFAELGHGLFTYVLMKALQGEADGAPKDGKVTIYELKSFIDDQVPEMTRKLKGKPQYPYTFSRGQDFPIVIEK